MKSSRQVTVSACKQAPGAFAPIVDRNRCEGKADCMTVCPNDVFVVAVLQQPDRRSLSFKGRVKGFAHGWKQAFTPNAGACEACGLCVSACPERAITLARA